MFLVKNGHPKTEMKKLILSPDYKVECILEPRILESRGEKSNRIVPNINAPKETKSVEPIQNYLNPIKPDSEANRKVQKRPNSVDSTSI